MSDLPDEPVLFQTNQLTSATYVERAMLQMLQWLHETSYPTPPLPPNPPSLAPCSILITEWEGPAGERMGRIRFVRNSSELFHREWLIAPAE